MEIYCLLVVGLLQDGDEEVRNDMADSIGTVLSFLSSHVGMCAIYSMCVFHFNSGILLVEKTFMFYLVFESSMKFRGVMYVTCTSHVRHMYMLENHIFTDVQIKVFSMYTCIYTCCSQLFSLLEFFRLPELVIYIQKCRLLL